FAVSGIASLLFLGGWHTGVLPWDLTEVLHPVLGNVLNVLVFIVKGWFLVLVMMWVRWTLPRLRIDQVMMTCLKYLLPISCALLLFVSIWQLALPANVLYYMRFAIAGVCVLAAVLVTVRLLTLRLAPPLTGMPGVWNMPNAPRYEAAAKP